SRRPTRPRAIAWQASASRGPTRLNLLDPLNFLPASATTRTNMSKRAAIVALVCALVGLGASTAASYTHYHLLFDPTYRSFCDVSSTISCTQVYASRFSTFRGVPVAVFGALAFAAAALLSIAGLVARQQVRESVPGYLFVLSTLSLAVILYLG